MDDVLQVMMMHVTINRAWKNTYFWSVNMKMNVWASGE